MKIYRGAILTLDSRNTIANTLVEDKGRIVYVGDLLPRHFRFNKKAEEIHLGDRVLIPSFVDSHIHFVLRHVPRGAERDGRPQQRGDPRHAAPLPPHDEG